MDSIRERVRQAMEWLKDNRLFSSNRAIAENMGYNPSVRTLCQEPLQHISAPEF